LTENSGHYGSVTIGTHELHSNYLQTMQQWRRQRMIITKNK